MKNIAVIGLGNMGGPMAANLVRAGFVVTGFDISPTAQEKAREAGVLVVGSVPEAVDTAEVVVTMLPNAELVAQALEAAVGAANQALFVDCSTVSPQQAQANAELVARHGHAFIDAPVSGGVVGATAGTLAFMVGGAEEDVDKAGPLFAAMGRVSTHCGGIGTGAAAKLCNNMILGVQQIVVAEALVLGERLGLTPESLYKVVSQSTGACWALTVNCPVPGIVDSSPANREFQPGFATDLIVKDLDLAMAAAHSTSTHTKLGALAAREYHELQENGAGDKDFGIIIQSVR